jgi:hypothetical protein
VLDGEVALDLKVPLDSFHHLDIEVVQCCSAGNEILRDLVISNAELDPLVAAQVIRSPSLSGLAFAADPIAKYLTAIRISLPLDHFPVHETTAGALAHRRIGPGSLRANIELRHARYM